MTLLARLGTVALYCLTILLWVYVTLRTAGAFILGNTIAGCVGVVAVVALTAVVLMLRRDMEDSDE